MSSAWKFDELLAVAQTNWGWLIVVLGAGLIVGWNSRHRRNRAQ